jgi:ribosomal protein S2
MVAGYTLKKLFAGKLFLGGFKRRFNPESTPYLLGQRHQIYILDMVHSNLRIRKLLSFVETASRRRINTLFILRKGWNFGPSLAPFSYYVEHYTGGILSNFAAVLRHCSRSQIGHYIKTFPGIVCAFTEHTAQTVHVLNEARRTRTVSTYLFDATMQPHPANYG